MNFNQVNIQDLLIDHDIEVNASSGQATGSVAIPLPSGRADFHPLLSLRYHSGGKNSVFGLGWNLDGLSFISLDTQKRLPAYDGTDGYCFNGSTSLIPQLIHEAAGWRQRAADTDDFWVYYYRAKHESEFTRFEKWVAKADLKTHWVARTKNNLVSVYGKNDSSSTKIYDTENEYKTFTWLLEEQYDGMGNAIFFHYRSDDHHNIDPLHSFESGRLKKFISSGFAQKYLQKIVYGNTRPLFFGSELTRDNNWLFEIVFDYGEFSSHPYTTNQPPTGAHWSSRADPFSVCNAGFELRTYRLCRRLLLFRHFEELGGGPVLTGIFGCNYEEKETGTTLSSVDYTGVRKELNGTWFSEKMVPRLSFTYSQPAVGNSFREVEKETNENIPHGLNDGSIRFVDLFGEGIPGILTESEGAWYYKENLGAGRFEKQELLIKKPAQPLGQFELGDFDGDGNIDLFCLQGRTAGYYTYDNNEEKWSGFNAFDNIPQVSKFKLLDVDSDGFPDLVFEKENKLVYCGFRGKEGFGNPVEFSRPLSDGSLHAPLIGGNLSLDYFLADMTGDGLPDQVRIRNGCVEYYPNLGHGRFGEVVFMEHAPLFDFESKFDASRIRLYDLNGTGTSDIIYIGNGEIRIWYNASGNKFIPAGTITNLPVIDNISSASINDFLGNGSACLVWSTTLSHLHYSTIQYLPLSDGSSPGLLTTVNNSAGKEISIEYGYSGNHYLHAKNSSSPWNNKMPRHFTVVNKKTVRDYVTNSRMVTEYKYRDGQYDGVERRFACFGMVTQYDTELFDATTTVGDTHSQPICTKTWFHSGVFGWDKNSNNGFYRGDEAQPFLNTVLFEEQVASDATDFQNALRGLAGRVMREEIFAADQSGVAETHPYQVNQHSYSIRQIQPATTDHEAGYFIYEAERLNCDYEGQPADPRVSHIMNLQISSWGDIEKQLSVFYARRSSVGGVHHLQTRDYITASTNSHANRDDLLHYRVGVITESKSFEVNFIPHRPEALLSLSRLHTTFDELIAGAIAFDAEFNPATSIAKSVSWQQIYFWNDGLDEVLPFGEPGSLALTHHEETACFTQRLIDIAFDGRVTRGMLSSADEGNYRERDGYWWQHSNARYYNSSDGFFTLASLRSGADTISVFRHDHYYLTIVEIADHYSNSTRAEIDYNIVQPFRITDPNENTSEVLYDALGVPVVSFHLGTVDDEGGREQLYGNGSMSEYVARSVHDFEAIISDPGYFLQVADHFHYYDFNNWTINREPLRSIRLTRRNLVHDGKGNINLNPGYAIEIDYQDGFGRTIQEKQKIAPGPAVKRRSDGSIELDTSGTPVLEDASERWLASGHIVFNNKQLAVKHFEPFFTSTPAFEHDSVLEHYGTAVHNHYDAANRIYLTNFADGSFTETRWSAWEMQSFDQNDTVNRSLYKTFREFLPDTDQEKIALNKSLAHRETPTIVALDPAGREILNTRVISSSERRTVEKRYDPRGDVVEIVDARGLIAFRYLRDMMGRLLHESSVDSGEQWSLPDNFDRLIHSWDSRGFHQQRQYDRLDRQISVQLSEAGSSKTTEKIIYGEDASVLRATQRNLRGRAVIQYDQAGKTEMLMCTPAGLPLVVHKRLTRSYLTEPDWSDPSVIAFDREVFTTKYVYDAAGRVTEQSLPDHTTRKFIFNDGGSLEKLLVSTADGDFSELELIKNISYDAKGLTRQLLFGNDVEANYSYDESNFRMKRLFVHARGAPVSYQDIIYHYDAAGNLVYMLDRAQDAGSAVIHGLSVTPLCEFEYDALYQLRAATGRVHQALLQHDYTDRSREPSTPADWLKGTRHLSLNNGAAVERYTRRYEYDIAGNIRSIRHSGTSQNWVTDIWTAANSNRSLPLNDFNGLVITNPESRFDAKGNCIYLPHLRRLEWNYRNNISKAVIIDRSAEGKPNDEEYYVYGSDGMRVRKITRRLIDAEREIVESVEKIYLDGCEIRRIVQGDREILKRYTSIITTGNNRVALIHSWERDDLHRETDDIAVKKIHYQLANHLGSASLELDEHRNLVSYEEYFPFGGTSFIAGDSVRQINLKDYRYCGKERDDFTGLYYFGYRYYAHWIGGWMSPDPLGPEDSENLYLYVHNNPVNLVDPNGLQTTTTTQVTHWQTRRIETRPGVGRVLVRSEYTLRSTTTYGIDERTRYAEGGPRRTILNVQNQLEESHITTPLPRPPHPRPQPNRNRNAGQRNPAPQTQNANRRPTPPPAETPRSANGGTADSNDHGNSRDTNNAAVNNADGNSNHPQSAEPRSPLPEANNPQPTETNPQAPDQEQGDSDQPQLLFPNENGLYELPDGREVELEEIPYLEGWNPDQFAPPVAQQGQDQDRPADPPPVYHDYAAVPYYYTPQPEDLVRPTQYCETGSAAGNFIYNGIVGAASNLITAVINLPFRMNADFDRGLRQAGFAPSEIEAMSYFGPGEIRMVSAVTRQSISMFGILGSLLNRRLVSFLSRFRRSAVPFNYQVVGFGYGTSYQFRVPGLSSRIPSSPYFSFSTGVSPNQPTELYSRVYRFASAPNRQQLLPRFVNLPLEEQAQIMAAMEDEGTRIVMATYHTSTQSAEILARSPLVSTMTNPYTAANYAINNPRQVEWLHQILFGSPGRPAARFVGEFHVPTRLLTFSQTSLARGPAEAHFLGTNLDQFLIRWTLNPFFSQP